MLRMQTIGQGKFGFHDARWSALDLDRCGAALNRCSLSPIPLLFSHFYSWADLTAGEKEKNHSNYSSNYLIISLCGGEQEGGRKWPLHFLSPSVLRSWWQHLDIFQSITFLHMPSAMDSGLPAQILLLFDLQNKHTHPSFFTPNCFLHVFSRSAGEQSKKGRMCRCMRVLTRNKLKQLKERCVWVCAQVNEYVWRCILGKGGELVKYYRMRAVVSVFFYIYLPCWSWKQERSDAARDSRTGFGTNKEIDISRKI